MSRCPPLCCLGVGVPGQKEALFTHAASWFEECSYLLSHRETSERPDLPRDPIVHAAKPFASLIDTLLQLRLSWKTQPWEINGLGEVMQAAVVRSTWSLSSLTSSPFWRRYSRQRLKLRPSALVWNPSFSISFPTGWDDQRQQTGWFRWLGAQGVLERRGRMISLPLTHCPEHKENRLGRTAEPKEW